MKFIILNLQSGDIIVRYGNEIGNEWTESAIAFGISWGRDSSNWASPEVVFREYYGRTIFWNPFHAKYRKIFLP